MSGEEQWEAVDGTLIQGADGSQYFISSEELKAFKLPDEDDRVPMADVADLVEGFDPSSPSVAERTEIVAHENQTVLRAITVRIRDDWVATPTIIPALVAGWESESTSD
jgi:hypothetical protein